jgi:hypothetical protein
MQIPRDERGDLEERTLLHLQQTHMAFQQAGGNIKTAKEFYNVISTPFFNIPVDQVKTIHRFIHTHMYLQKHGSAFQGCT